MRTITPLLLLLLALVAGTATAQQRRFVVADVETLVPVQGANVVGKGFTIQTDSLGRCEMPDSSRSLVLSHVNYESRIVNTDEITGDTIFLISKLLMVNGVVVFGQAKADERIKELKKRLALSKSELQLLAADPGRGTDLLKLLNYIVPKKKKKLSRKQRLKQVLKEY